MAKFMFIPGYYEWHLMKNDKLIYVVNSDTIEEDIYNMEQETGHEITLNELREVVEDELEWIIESMKDDSYSRDYEDVEIPTSEEQKQIVEVMVEGYANHFGIEN